MTSLATIAQLVRKLGFSVVGGYALESAGAQVCREAGGSVSTNVMVAVWRLSSTGLPLFSGAQLAVDTTMVSPLHRDGTARRGAALSGEKVLEEARRRKERTYPELSGAGGRARVGGPRRHSGREDGLRRPLSS